MTVPLIRDIPMTEAGRRAARLSFASGGLFFGLLGALHLLAPEIDPSWRFISEYQLGDHGWMMRLAFCALGVSTLALALALWSQLGPVVRYFGGILLGLSAVGMVLAGIFITDPATVPADQATGHGKLHQLGAMLDLIPYAAVLIGWDLTRHAAWASSRPLLLWTAVLPLLGTLVFVGALATLLPANEGRFGPEVAIGWPNRLMIIAHGAWLLLIARKAALLPRR